MPERNAARVPPAAPGPGAGPAPAAAPEDCYVPAGCDWPVVLGIDPGTRVLGWGAVVLAPGGARLVAAGVLRPARNLEPAGRLAELLRDLPPLIARCRPAAVVIERAFAARNVHSALRLGESRGVVLACAAAAGARVVEIAPASARRAVLGNGAGSKEQVHAMVQRLLGLAELPLPLDASAALALALAELRRMERAAALLRAAPRAAAPARPARPARSGDLAAH